MVYVALIVCGALMLLFGCLAAQAQRWHEFFALMFLAVVFAGGAFWAATAL